MIDNNEAKILIEKQSITLDNCGIDRFPGKIMELDSYEIKIRDEILNIKLLIWFDKGDSGQPMFIIKYGLTFIIMDYYHEASGVWEYLLKKYPC